MAKTDFLQRMAASSRQRSNILKANGSASIFTRRIKDIPPAQPLTLAGTGFDIIAEIKRKSPAAGELFAAGDSMTQQAQTYQAAGAIAVSVLTEPSAFDGDVAELSNVASVLSCPAMRKDFLVDPIQVLEARAHGASGVLLIVRMLNEIAMRRLLDAAAELGMFAVLEVFAANDVAALECALDQAARCGAAAMTGVNCRDLTTLEVNQDRHEELRQHLPDDLPVIAESGVTQATDVAHLAGMGFRAALVGTALMRAVDTHAVLQGFLKAGRRAALARSAT